MLSVTDGNESFEHGYRCYVSISKITCQEGTNTSILIQVDILRKLRFRNFDYIDGNIIFEYSYKIYSKIPMSYVYRQ